MLDADNDDEFAQYDREQRELEAWRMLVEMRGDLHYHDGLATWLVSYPTGEPISWPIPGEGADRGREGDDDPIVAVERAHRDWAALGRPTWPVEFDVELGEDDPDATDRQRRPDEGGADVTERLSLDSLVEQVIDERDDTMREVVRLRAEVKQHRELLARAAVLLTAIPLEFWEARTIRQLLADVAALDQPKEAADARG